MMHLDEGRLVALRDDGIDDDPEAVEHLASCETCRSTFEGARLQAETITRALSSLDDGVDLEAARATVRARVAAATAPAAGSTTLQATRWWHTRAALSRAAGLVLLTAAGVAAAIPGSPVRSWIERVVTDGDRAGVPSATVETPEEPAEEAGIRLAAQAGPVRIVLLGLEPGDEVRVRLVPGSEAAVFAPSGSRFTSAEGRIEAAVTSGPVRVEVPRDVLPVIVEVNGRTLLRNTSGGLDVLGPVPDQVGEDLVFRLQDQE